MIDAVGVWFYSTTTDRYLYLLRNDAKNPGCWGLPGGKVDGKEGSNSHRNWYQRITRRQSMQYLIPTQRIDIIYDMLVHGGSAVSIAERHGINYTTVINALRGYQQNGRIFKLLPIHSKNFILKNRVNCKISQRLYRIYRNRRLNVWSNFEAPGNFSKMTSNFKGNSSFANHEKSNRTSAFDPAANNEDTQLE